jgi:hypothetical protein
MTECAEKLTYITFDYKITAGGVFNIALMPNWDSYFGYFAFDVNGNIDPYDGITCEKLENGYIRATFDMAKLTKYSGSPAKVIEFLYVRGNWTDATGEITNICLYWDDTQPQPVKMLVMRTMNFLVSSKKWMKDIMIEEIPDNQ